MARLLFAFIGLVLALAAPGRVLAHAYLERSSPAGNTVIEQAPERIQLWFTERPELRFSDVTLYTSDGQVIPHGPITLAPDNPRSILFDLAAVPHGTYTAAWKTLSIDDGHTAAGAFAFAVGLEQPPPTAESIFVPAGQAADVGKPSALAVLGRWLGYGGMALLGGGPFFLLVVLWPALRSGSRSERGTVDGAPGPEAATILGRLHWLGIGLAAIGALAGLLGQAVSISGSDSAALRATLVDLLGTRSGLLLGCRFLALIGAAVAVWHLARRGWTALRADWGVPLALVCAVGLLLAQALGSHAAATPLWPNFTVGVDWIHLAAMSVWLGGLAVLGLAVPWVIRARPEHERPVLLAGVVNRFSAIALWCVLLLALTGLYQSWVHVGQLDGFTRTGYGATLLVKLALIVPLLILGALNLLVNRRSLSRTAAAHARQAREQVGGLARRLRFAVRAEVVLGAAVLLTTGVLANLPPARDALSQLGKLVTRTVEAEGLKLTLTVDPAVAGLNTYDVAIADGRGNPVVDAERVALRFTHTQHEMGEIEAVLRPRGDGHYTAQGSYLSMAGVWNVDLRVRLPGRPDVSAPVEVAAADPSASDAARGAQTPSLGTSFLLGLELLVAALLLAIGGPRLRLPLARPFNRLAPRLAGAALGVAGLYFLTTGIMNDLTPTAALANPIPPTRASVERGQQIYEENCSTCHGDFGRGDGPTGRFLRPRPADLREHVAQHTEGQLYWWISKGVPGSAMPAWEDKLSEEDRWNVLNYMVQTFRPEANPSPAPSPAAGG